PGGQRRDPLVSLAASLGAKVTPVCVPASESESIPEKMAANRAAAVRHQGAYPVTGAAYASAVPRPRRWTPPRPRAPAPGPRWADRP
ncbi:MAG: hypothetical protein M3O32_17290, partial [Actinomycetota bacterium]|nr:hypothetical protein [Actinomycetota bacterium]